MSSGLRTSVFRLKSFSKCIAKRTLTQSSASLNLAVPQPDNQPKVYSPKIEKIFQSISELSLLEVSELSDILKKRLNLPDAPVMGYGAMAAPATATPAAEPEEVVSVQTSFTVKLMSFDDKQKIALIKELKAQLPDMNLVQAKKFIESAPAIVKSDIGKTEAESLKEALTKVGGQVVIE